ncbi:MAG: hypothetical protein ABIP74_01070 [Candidatus Saccharimonas sp.]
MFRKLISNLGFSPALVGQLAFYAKRLKREETTRRLGLLFTVFALIIQAFVVFAPPTSANSADSNDMCPGITRDSNGVKKIKACYNNNTRHYQDIMTYFGISKSELWKALDNGAWRYTTTYKNWYTFGHESRSSDVKNYSSAVAGKLYARKWKNTIQTRQYGWKGKSGETEFIILADCGNLSLKRLLNPSAKCISLIASKHDIAVGDSIVLTAKSATDDGAEIAGYDFTQDGPGTNDAKSSVKSSAETATWQRTLPTAGTYKFTVDIDTTNNKDNITAKTCAEIVTVAAIPQAPCPYNPALPANDVKCKPPTTPTCPYNPSLPVNDVNCKPSCTTNPELPGCAPDISITKTAVNRSQNDIDATTKNAQAGDVIVYTITMKNTGKTAGTVVLDDVLSDPLEYSQLTELGGGSYDKTSQALSWGSLTIQPGATTTRQFVMTVYNPIPAMAKNQGSPDSYDCVMSNVVRKDGEGIIKIPVECPVVKEVVEQTVTQLPHTGPTENIVFAGMLLATVSYFYARTRLMRKEVRLIRRDLNIGTI